MLLMLPLLRNQNAVDFSPFTAHANGVIAFCVGSYLFFFSCLHIYTENLSVLLATDKNLTVYWHHSATFWRQLSYIYVTYNMGLAIAAYSTIAYIDCMEIVDVEM